MTLRTKTIEMLRWTVADGFALTLSPEQLQEVLAIVEESLEPARDFRDINLERRAKEVFKPWPHGQREVGERIVEALRKTQREVEAYYCTLHPVSEFHDDIGSALWHHIPVCEPPYVGPHEGMDERTADGEPTDCARLQREGWLTHWSILPNPLNPDGE